MRDLLNVEEVAKLLRTTPESLRTLMSAGKDVPPSFLIGRRRVFLRRNVFDWLYRKAGVTNRDARPTDSHGGSLSAKGNPMTAALNEIAEGDVFLDEEEDDEYTIKKVHPQSGYAVLEDSEENEKTVSLKSLLDAIESGDLVRQDDDEGKEK